jgi:hypothetical protein
MVGANWRGIKYGQNFGTTAWFPTGNGISKYPDFVQDNLDYMRRAGIKVARVGLLEDGRTMFDKEGHVTGYNKTFSDDVKTLLALANQAGIKVEFTIFDYLIAGKGENENGVWLRGRSQIITNEALRTEFRNQFLIPFLKEFGGHAALIGFDVINEPEWVVSKKDGGSWEDANDPTKADMPVPGEIMKGFITDCLNNIRAYAPGKMVTVGISAKFIPLVKELSIDYFALHYYPWMGEFKPYLNLLPTGKPWSLEEYPTRETVSISNYLDLAFKEGGAGAMLWNFTPEIDQDTFSYAERDAKLLELRSWTETQGKLALTEMKVGEMPTVGESVTISGKLLKNGKGFKTTLGVHDSVSQQSRQVQTGADGSFSFTTLPVPRPDSYLISFLVDEKEIDVLNLVVPAGLYQPAFLIDDPNIKLTVGQNGAPLPESDITAAYSKKVAGEPEKTGLKSRMTAGSVASTFFQKWVEENITPTSIAYWVVTGIVCLAPEPVVTKGACAAMATIGVGAANAGAIKAALKTVNELAVEDESLKKNIDTAIDVGDIWHGIHDLSKDGTALEGVAEVIGMADDFASTLNKENITDATLLDVSMSDTGEVTGYRMEVITKDEQVIEIVAAKPKPGIVVAGKSPIDIIVTAPNGARFGKEVQGIEGAKYYELDIDLDGDKDDLVMLPTPPSGKYSVEVIPEPGAALTDTYSLEVMNGDEVIVLVEEQTLQEATQPITLEVKTTDTGEVKIEPLKQPVKAKPWDVDGNGVVDILDMVRVAKRFGELVTNAKEDLNGDGVVNILDLVTVAVHFGEVTNPKTPAAP